MATVRLSFNPDEIKPSDECWPAFQAGGMTLTFWALYKRTHITSQFFRSSLELLAEYYEDAYDKEKEDAKPYTNIDEFVAVLRACRLPVSGYTSAWVAKHWDYFNLSIRRTVTLEFEVIETVTKKKVISSQRGAGDE